MGRVGATRASTFSRAAVKVLVISRRFSWRGDKPPWADSGSFPYARAGRRRNPGASAETIPVKGQGLGHGDLGHQPGRVLDSPQPDFLDSRPQLFQHSAGFQDRRADLVFQASQKIFFGKADPQAPHPVPKIAPVIDDGDPRGRIDQGVQHQGRILNRTAHGAHMVEAESQGNHAPPEEPDASGLRPTIRRPRRECGWSRRYPFPGRPGTGRRSPRPRFPARSAGDPIQVPGVVHRAEMRIDAGHPVGELMEVGLAEQDGAGLEQAVDAMAFPLGIKFRRIFDPAVVRTPFVLKRSFKLIGIPWSGPRYLPAAISFSARRPDGGEFGGHRKEGVEGGVEPGNPVQKKLRKLHGRNFPLRIRGARVAIVRFESFLKCIGFPFSGNSVPEAPKMMVL